jgi:hypothetical protein
MEVNMVFGMNSSLLHITQPCLYWVFREYLYNIEQDEMEYREERAHEIVNVPERGQPWLWGFRDKKFGDKKMFPGETALSSIRRMNLPEGHPEYQGLQECSLDWDRAQEIIARCWLETLEEWIADRYRAEGIKDVIQVSFKSVYSPREYNFGGDRCGFSLSASMESLRHIVEKCLIEYRGSFADYLREAHSSYSGYHSWVSNDIEDHDRYWEYIWVNGEDVSDSGSSRADRIEHAVWTCLDFWLFGIEDMESGDTGKLEVDGIEQRFGKNQDVFEERLWDKVIDAESDGAFHAIMEYKPIKVEGAA